MREERGSALGNAQLPGGVSKGLPKSIQARRGGLSGTWRGTLRFARNYPLGAAGGAICLFFVMLAVLAPIVATHAPREIIGLSFEDPTGLFSWGTDYLGRDVFSRMIFGSRLSLLIGFTATLWGTTAGYTWGLLQGYFGGTWFDTISQRINEAQLSIPSLILALTFVAVFGPSIRNVIIAIGMNYVATGARTVRSLSLSIRENAYIDAAKALGAPTWRIIFFHVLPNTLSIYLILMSLHIGGAILAEASLSFLGAGVPVDTPSWGGMVNQGTKQALLGGVPYLALFPGIAIALTVYGFNLLGDALRDTLDPRLRGSR